MRLQLIVIRFDAHGNLANSEPCVNCTRRIKYFHRNCMRIDKVIWSVAPNQLMMSTVDNLNNTYVTRGDRIR
jgi:hypothetical protein